MPGMNTVYLNAIASHGASIINYIGLVNENGEELEGENYERVEVYWDESEDGIIRPYGDEDHEQNVVISVPGGSTVAGWRGYSEKEGGTNYGGADFAESESYTNDGKFELIAEDSGIIHNTG